MPVCEAYGENEEKFACVCDGKNISVSDEGTYMTNSYLLKDSFHYFIHRNWYSYISCLFLPSCSFSVRLSLSQKRKSGSDRIVNLENLRCNDGIIMSHRTMYNTCYFEHPNDSRFQKVNQKEKQPEKHKLQR